MAGGTSAVRLCKFPLRLLFSIITVLPLVLVISAVTLLFLPYRLLVQLLARLLRPDLAHIVTGGSNGFFSFNTSSTATSNVCSVLVLQGRITLEQVRTLFKERVLSAATGPGGTHRKFEKLLQTVKPFMGYRFYASAAGFDLTAHVRRYDDNDGAGTMTEKRLGEACGRLVGRPWTHGQSHWELLVIEEYEGGGESVLIFRVNHNLADGYSVLHILFTLFGSADRVPQYLGTPGSRGKGRLWRRWIRTVRRPLEMMWDTAELMTESMPANGSQYKVREKERGLGVLSAFSDPIPVYRIKDIKNAFHVSYTAVLLTALAGALRRILVESGRPVPEGLILAFPIPKRNHPGGMTNHASSCQFVLPLLATAGKSPVRTLVEIDRNFRHASTSSAPAMMDWWSDMLTLLPSVVSRIPYSIVNFEVGGGNVPVLSEDLYLENRLLTDYFLCAANSAFPTPNAISVSMGGANGRQRIFFSVYKAAFPFPEIFHRVGSYIAEEINWLYEAAGDKFEVV